MLYHQHIIKIKFHGLIIYLIEARTQSNLLRMHKLGLHLLLFFFLLLLLSFFLDLTLTKLSDLSMGWYGRKYKGKKPYNFESCFNLQSSLIVYTIQCPSCTIHVYLCPPLTPPIAHGFWLFQGGFGRPF